METQLSIDEQVEILASQAQKRLISSLKGKNCYVGLHGIYIKNDKFDEEPSYAIDVVYVDFELHPSNKNFSHNEAYRRLYELFLSRSTMH